MLNSRGGIEDTRLEAKAKVKDTKNSKAKDRPSRGQGRRTQAQVFSKKKGLQKFFFRRSPLEGNKKRFSQIFREVSGVFQQKFNNSKNSAVLEPRKSNFRGLEASRPRPRTSKCVFEDSTSVKFHQ